MNNIIKFLKENEFYFKENYNIKNINGLKLNIISSIYVEIKKLYLLPEFLLLLDNEKIPYYILGGGYNTISFKSKYNGVIIKLGNFFKFANKNKDTGYIHLGSATKNNDAIRLIKNLDKMGLECLFAVPGTIGGSLVGNSGTKKETISKYLKYITVIDGGKICNIDKKYIIFEYRKSNIKNIILEAVFDFPNFSLDKHKEKINNIKKIKKRQPYQYPSVGCIFKNPKKYPLSAAKLIENINYKSSSILEVSKDHHNFIINKNKEAVEPKKLKIIINDIKEKVEKKYNIKLDLEPKILDDRQETI